MTTAEKSSKALLHRISHHQEISYPLLERGVLSTGWSALGIHFTKQAGLLESCRNKDDFETEFKKVYEHVSRNIHSCRKFVIDMQQGDIIAVPSWGCFHVYKVTSDVFLAKDLDITGLASWKTMPIMFHDGYLYEGERCIDLGFFRKVELVERDIKRTTYASAALVSMLKFRGTTNIITHLQSDIDDAIRNKRDNTPINLAESIKNDERVLDISYEKMLKQINPDTFEKLVEAYFLKAGARIDLQNSGKGDADKIAAFENIKTNIYIQIKKHDGTTNKWAVEQIKAYRERQDLDTDYGNVAMVISTAEQFSEECVRLANEANVVLINGREFIKMILEIGLSDIYN